MNYLYRDRLVAEIYRPAAETMARTRTSAAVGDVLDVTVHGGRELIRAGGIFPETMARIKQPVSDFDSLAALGNLYWKTLIEEGVTPQEFDKRGMIPRADSIETYLLVMKVGFNPAKAGDLRVTMQYDFSGEVKGSCYLTIENGSIQTGQGPAEHPDLIIETPFELWMDIGGGQGAGAQVLMDGRYGFKGDPSLLMRMGEAFGR